MAARNYALRCMSTRSSNAYHMVDTASDQVFRGYEGSNSVIRAVDETRNMTLYAGSAIASCYYSASNGGQTEATRNVWGGNLSYSTVKDDLYDLANPSATVKTDAIRRDATGLDARLMQAPVSYTHLDVYKRQAPDSINPPEFPDSVLYAGEKYDYTTIFAFIVDGEEE